MLTDVDDKSLAEYSKNAAGKLLYLSGTRSPPPHNPKLP